MLDIPATAQYTSKAFWSRDDSDDSDSPLVYVAGLNDAGNQRRPVRSQQQLRHSVEGKRTQEIRASIPIQQPPIEELPLSLHDDKDFIMYERFEKKQPSKISTDTRPKKPVLQSVPHNQMSRKQNLNNSNKNKLSNNSSRRLSNPEKSVLESSLLSNVDRDRNRQMNSQKENVGPYFHKASLKDLRAEDKQRVANLVKELARIGDEKESAVETLFTERINFEKQITDLLDQQEKVLKEREVIQRQLYECQKLLGGYQHQLLEHERQPDEARQRKRDQTRRKSNETTPTRSEPPNAVDPKEFTPSPRQQGNYDIREETSGQKSKRTPDEKNRPKISPRSVPHVSTSRPFTDRIDHLLEENAKKPARDDGKLYRAIPARAELPKEPLFGIGPLSAPMLSSTGRSDATSKPGEFHPLQSYESMSTSLDTRPVDVTPKKQVRIETTQLKQAENSTDEQGFIAYCHALPPDERRHQLVVQREALLEEQKRLRQILTEQESLLHQKQDQLHLQQQLQTRRLQFFHNTGYFPPPSDHPDPSAYIAPVVSVAAPAVHPQTLHQSTVPVGNTAVNYNHENNIVSYDNDIRAAATSKYPVTAQQAKRSDIQPESHAKQRLLTLPATRYLSQDNPPPGDTYMQNVTTQTPRVVTTPPGSHYHEVSHGGQHRESPAAPSEGTRLPASHRGVVEDIMWPAAQYLPPDDNTHRPYSYEELSESITESLKNLNFLENHGVKVSTPRKIYHHTKKTQSAGSSPSRPSPAKRSSESTSRQQMRTAAHFDSNGELDKVVEHLNNIESRRPASVPVRTGKQQSHLLDAIDTNGFTHLSPSNLELSDSSSHLLDIVDEVESLHSDVRESCRRTSVTPSRNGYDVKYREQEEEEDRDDTDVLEESQVLSEVFFVN